MERVYAEWNRLQHYNYPSADAYIEHARQLLQRIRGNESDPAAILHVESRLSERFRAKLNEEKQKRKIQLALADAATAASDTSTATAVGNATEFRFDNLHQLQQAARELESIYPWLLSKQHHRPPYTGRRQRDGKDEDVDDVSVNKLEPSSSGTPRKVGGKKAKGPHRQTRRDRPPSTRTASSSQPPPTRVAQTSTDPAVAAAVPGGPPSQTSSSSSSSAPPRHSQGRPRVTCGKCHKQGHTTAEHVDNHKPTCGKCGGTHPTHRHDSNSQPSAKSVQIATDAYVPTAPALASFMVAPAACTHATAFITSSQLGGNAVAYREVLLDSGADISCVNRQLVLKHKIAIVAPSGPSMLRGFGSSMAVKRHGTVDLRVCVHLPLNTPSTITFNKTFEVIDMDDDFLIGRDALPALFPNDAALRYSKPHSIITDTPRDINQCVVDDSDDDYGCAAAQTRPQTNGSGVTQSHDRLKNLSHRMFAQDAHVFTSADGISHASSNSTSTASTLTATATAAIDAVSTQPRTTTSTISAPSSQQ
jgi:hypothetical protein